MEDQNTQVTIGSGVPGTEHIPEHMRPVSAPPMKSNYGVRPFIYGAMLIILIAAGIFWWHGRNNDAQALQSKPAVVEIRTNGFYPATVRIAKGQSVEWINTDSTVHQVATDPFPLENGLAGFYDQTPLDTSETYSFTFNKTGTFTYHDHLNPVLFQGTIIVK